MTFELKAKFFLVLGNLLTIATVWATTLLLVSTAVMFVSAMKSPGLLIFLIPDPTAGIIAYGVFVVTVSTVLILLRTGLLRKEPAGAPLWPRGYRAVVWPALLTPYLQWEGHSWLESLPMALTSLLRRGCGQLSQYV
jgi:hypothetical protein